MESEDCSCCNDYESNDIRNICTSEEVINEQFSYGRYGMFNLVIMKKNGYINACRISSPYQSKRQFTQWQDSNAADDIVKPIAKYTGIPRHKLFIESTTNLILTRGTFVHPSLIPHILSWIYPQFTLEVSEIVNQHYINGVTEERRNRMIDELVTLISRQSARISNQGRGLKELIEMAEKCENEKVSVDEYFMVIRSEIDSSSSDTKYRYFVLQNMKEATHNDTVARYKKNIVLTIFHTSTLTLWPTVKKILSSVKRRKIDVNVSGTAFNLVNNYTEKQLIKDINRILEQLEDE